MIDRLATEIEAALDAAAAALTERTGLDAGSLRAAAVGLATVDLERALASIGGPEGAAVADPFLGARGIVIEPSEFVVRLVLLEPSTEGRLAAFLARHAEAVVATWHAVATADPGSVVGSVRVDGALGATWWIRDPIATGTAGPYRFLIEGAPATIDA